MFDAKRFLKTKFTPRTEVVPVPDLRQFFPDGEEAVWKVRGLTGAELGRANEAAARNKNIAAVLEALAGEAAKEKADAVKELLGVGGTTPEDIAKRIEHLVLGSVEPKCTPDLAVRLSEAFPIEFFQITNRVMNLTGQGMLPGKQPPSGATEKSGPPSRSATSGGDSSLKPGPTCSPAAG
jgi:hypothetical protein